MKKNYLIIGLTFLHTCFSSAQELNGLVAKYSFNSGNTNDEVGIAHGNNSGATLTTDRFGNQNKAYAFDAANSAQIIIPSAGSNTFTNTDPFAFALWVKFSSTNESSSLVAGKGVIDGSWNGYSFYSNNTDQGYCNGPGTLMFFTASAGMEDACADNLVAANFTDWQFVVGNYGGTTQSSSLFVDGVAQSDIGSITGTLAANSDLFLGGYPVNQYTHFFTGSIDDIRIFNRTLTQQEITQLYTESDPTLSIKELNEQTISIAPNPAKEKISIHSEKPTHIAIQNILGEQLIDFEINDDLTLDVSTFVAGIYFISTSEGVIQRLIVQ